MKIVNHNGLTGCTVIMNIGLAPRISTISNLQLILKESCDYNSQLSHFFEDIY